MHQVLAAAATTYDTHSPRDDDEKSIRNTARGVQDLTGVEAALDGAQGKSSRHSGREWRKQRKTSDGRGVHHTHVTEAEEQKFLLRAIRETIICHPRP